MPTTTDELVSLLTLDDLGGGRFRGHQPHTLLQRTFGGQVLAQALMAAQQTVAEERVCHSLHAYFLQGGDTTQPIHYDVERTRDGGSFSSRRVVARQGSAAIFSMSCSFHTPEHGLDHSASAPTGVPAPEDCPRVADVLADRYQGTAALWREWESLDVRFAGDSRPDGRIDAQEAGARMRVWVKTSEALPDDPRLHRAVLAYLSDLTLLSVAVVPHQVVFLSPQVQAASIDHSMRFHRAMRADEWMLHDQASPSASNALGFSTGGIFQGGLLGASCSQEGLIRVLDR